MFMWNSLNSRGESYPFLRTKLTALVVAHIPLTVAQFYQSCF